MRLAFEFGETGPSSRRGGLFSPTRRTYTKRAHEGSGDRDERALRARSCTCAGAPTAGAPYNLPVTGERPASVRLLVDRRWSARRTGWRSPERVRRGPAALRPRSGRTWPALSLPRSRRGTRTALCTSPVGIPKCPTFRNTRRKASLFSPMTPPGTPSRAPPS